MTTVINSDTAIFYINNPGPVGSIGGTFSLKSQYSQKDISTGNGYTILEHNDRYAKISVDFPIDFKNEHQNGFYTWTLGNYSDIVKIITQPGGGTGEVEYISNNENREADVYFRPNY